MSNSAVQNLDKKDTGLNTGFGAGLRRAGAGIAAAAQLAGGSLPAVSAGTSLVAPTAAVVGAAFLGTTQKGDAAVVMTAADLTAAYALGAAQDDIVWFRGVSNNISTRGSGILIRGAEHDYVLSAGHLAYNSMGLISTTGMSVGNGSSYLNDLGLTSGVSSIYISPTYTVGDKVGGDYMFLQLTNRISSSNSVFNLGLTPQYGDSILFAGYGLPGTMNGSSVANTGNAMGFYASYSSLSLSTWNDAYDTGFFNGNSDSGYEISRGSGGKVSSFNPSTGKWETFGMTVAGNSANATYFYSLNNADQNFNNYLSNVVRPVVPEPSTSLMISLGALSLISYRKRNKNAELA